MADQKKKVLCCDDEVDLCDMIAEELEYGGFQVFKANSGNAALKILEKESIDVIVSDVRMPDGDGFALLKAVRAKDPVKPVVIFLSGFTDMSPELAFQEGAEAILEKPLDFNDFIATVKRYAGSGKERYQRVHERMDESGIATISAMLGHELVTNPVINIGRGGFFVKTETALPDVGAKVRFSVKLDSTGVKAISGIGVCRWIRSPAAKESNSETGFGVEFLWLEGRSIEFLEEFLKTRKDARAFIPSGMN